MKILFTLLGLSAPSIAFADPGHPMLYEAHEVLHYFTSIHHLWPTALAIGVSVGLTFGVRRILGHKKDPSASDSQSILKLFDNHSKSIR